VSGTRWNIIFIFQTLSYNGHLIFTLTNALPAAAYETTKKTAKPQIYIVGNYKIHLQYIGEIVGNEQSNIQTVDVVLREVRLYNFLYNLV